MRRSSATRHYLIRRDDGELLARAQTVWVWVDAVTGRPVQIQPEWWKDFEGQTAAG